jgi:hypothetical protein
MRTWEVRFIYFVQSKEHVKIGSAKHVRRRVEGIQTSCVHYAKFLGCFAQGFQDLKEKDVHRLFQSNHYRGEWFELTPEIQSFIDRTMSAYITSIDGQAGDSPHI